MLERVKELSSLKNYIELKKYLTSLDPAIMAAPIITTIVDCCSVFAFFNIALLFIG